VGVQTSMRIVALAGLVVVLAACGSGAGTSAPPGTPSVGATTAAPSPGTDAPLPALDSPAPAWRFAPPTAPDPARIGALEAALGGPVSVAGDAPQSWTFAAATPPTPSTPGAVAVDARAVATAIWSAAGLDPSTLDVTVSPDGSTVTGTERLDGVASPLPFVVTVGASGTVVAASGHLATPAPAGDQVRTGTAAAIGRLPGTPAGDDRGEQQPSLRPDPTPAVPPLGPQPTTQPTVVDQLMRPVTGVDPTYLVTPATDGGAWLLPAYRIVFDDGSTRTVLAVPAPPTDSSATADPSGLVGLPEDQAAAEAAAKGWTYRVAERDGVQPMLTADYLPDRVNVAITNGTVTRAWMG
jgi:hypothetical protein